MIDLRSGAPAPPEAVGEQAATPRAARRRPKAVMPRIAGWCLAFLMLFVLGAVALNLFAEAARRGGPHAGTSDGVAAAAAPPSAVASADLDTTLVVGTRVGGPHAEAGVVWLALVSRDALGHAASVVYVPPDTAAEIPGHGLGSLGSAYSSGGVSLLRMSTENLLDVDIDHQLELSNADARRLFASIGALSVDVPVEVRTDAGHDRARLLFSPGRQVLSPSSLAALLYISGIDGDDTDVATRHLAFWDALVDAFSSDPAALETAVARAGRAVDDSDVGAEENAHLLGAVVGTDARGLTLGMLPVREVGAGTSRLYQVDSETAGDMLEGIARAPGVDAASTERVQVLNGNGAPGIGESVGRRLVNAGFTVTLSGNARRLNHGLTRVVTYDASPTGRAEARRVRGLLGVGRVQISPQTQGIVNLTVVIGRDFLRAN